MKWKHCNYCPLDGTCENQDRGCECEMPIKKLLEENQQLKKDNRIFEEKIHNSYLKMGQLKELLKKCRLAIFDYPPYNSASDKIRLKNKIDDVLGEKK